MTCTGEILDLGCIGHCNTTIPGLPVPESGVYTLKYTVDNVDHLQAFEIENDNDEIPMAPNIMPVNREIIFQLLDPNGDVVEIQEFQYFRIFLKILINH